MNHKKKFGWMNVVDNLIWAVIGALIVLIIIMDIADWLKAVYLGALGVFAIFYLWFVYYKATNEIVVAPDQRGNTSGRSHITTLLLLNEQNQVLRQWSLEGRAGLIIGKNGPQGNVDIDLSDTAQAPLISNEHAVLNYTGNGWFVEDYDSEHGTGVQKYNSREIIFLNRSEPKQLECGDYIYIGNTILQVR